MITYRSVFCRSLLLSLLLAAALTGWDPIAVYTLLQTHPDEQMAIQWVTPESRKKSTLIFVAVSYTHLTLPTN